MRINVMISIKNEMISLGISKMVSEGLVSSSIKVINIDDILDSMNIYDFDIAIIEIKKFKTFPFTLIAQMKELNPKVKIFLFCEEKVSSKVIKFIKSESLGLIIDTFSSNEVLTNLREGFLKRENKISSTRLKKRMKLKSSLELLSARELEVGFMLISGETISSISEKKNIAKTTVCTYKKRIFEKTEVKNLIQMAELFKKNDVKLA